MLRAMYPVKWVSFKILLSGRGGRVYDFNAVETGFEGTLCGMAVVFNCILDILDCHLLGCDGLLHPFRSEVDLSALELRCRG